jgi:hypothetical protein
LTDANAARLRALEQVFGPEVGSHVALLERVVPSLEGTKYQFMPETEFVPLLTSDIPAGMRVYWRELLFRAHWGAASSLLRALRWLSGIEDGVNRHNLIVLTACMRGFLESSADTSDGLNGVHDGLADAYDVIADALAGRIKVIATHDAEEKLLHFTFASRGSEREGAVYQAKSVPKYLDKLRAEEPALGDLYGLLCDIVHPGARSVLSFAASADGDHLELSSAAEASEMAQYVALIPGATRTTAAFGITLPLLLLKVLNVFVLPEVHTAALDHVHLDGMPA